MKIWLLFHVIITISDFNKHVFSREEFVYYQIIVCQAERYDNRIFKTLFLKVIGKRDKILTEQTHKCLVRLLDY